MKKRFFSILTALALCLTLLPTAAFAENGTEKLPVCICETTCTAESTDLNCAACGAEGALAEGCGKYAAGEMGQDNELNNTPTFTAADVQALIDALPDGVTADNAETVEKQLVTIDEALAALSGEQLAKLDMTRYEAICEALAGMTAVQEGHTHYLCGGNACTGVGDHVCAGKTTFEAWPSDTSLPETGVYYLTQDVTLEGGLAVTGELTLDLNGHSIQARAERGTVIYIERTGSFTLTDCNGSNGVHYFVKDADRNDAWKLSTQSELGSFAVDGGIITHGSMITGKGVSVAYGGRFTMYNGTICGNYLADNRGAGVELYESAFTMYGGAIKGNATTTGGGVFVNGNCAFTMHGGEISNNRASGSGGGVYVGSRSSDSTDNAVFTMTGGEIRGNAVTGKAANGGGVYVGSEYGSEHSNAVFTMSGGEIRGNAATDTTANGGGVYVGGKINDAAFTMTGGTITENTATGSTATGGVCMGDRGTLRLSGSVEIKDNKANNTNSNVYLPDGTAIEITGNLTGSASAVGVTLENMPVSGKYTAFAKAASGVSLTDADKNAFFIDNDNGTCRLTYGSSEVLITCGVQYTLAPGGRYYFDLSALGIPGTVNSDLPDSTLHYVPFTYVGTVDAYVLKPASNGVADSSEWASVTTDKDAQYGYAYEHSLFIADYKVTSNISWVDLNNAGFIFGRAYTVGGINYTLRAPTVGSSANNENSNVGVPDNNEWDQILAKNSGLIKVTDSDASAAWGQDTTRSENGKKSTRNRFSNLVLAPEGTTTNDVCYRPILELPTDLAADSLKVVEVRTGETKIPGETGNFINIIVKKGESFKAPSAEGLPRPDGISADAQLWWEDEDGNYYKPGDTVPADVSALYALWGGFGLLLDRGDGAVEVTPDNYTDIFGDGSASFVLPKGESFCVLINNYQMNEAERQKIYLTGRYGENIFPNLKLKNAKLTSVTLNQRYIEQQSPLFITPDGENTIGSLNGVEGISLTLSILGGGTLALNSVSDFGVYAQNDVSVTITDAMSLQRIYMFSGSLTVTDDTQAVTLDDTFDGFYPLDARVFTGSSAQDAKEATGWQLSPEMRELYRRFYAGETLTNNELGALTNAIKEQWNVIRAQLSGKTYARFTNAWDVTYQPGTYGTGDAVTDIKFYGDALTLRDKLFTRTGYTQTGWATVDGGEKVCDLSGVYTNDAALTLYPVWTRSSSGGSSAPTYPVSTPDKIENGSVTVSPKNASRGDTVTITVEPDGGYELETIAAIDKNGNELKLTDKGDGKYTFAMPSGRVEIKATFMEDNFMLNFFYDVPNDAYYYEAVKWAVRNGITDGIGNSLFGPDLPCTRAQIVTFLWRAAGSPEPKGTAAGMTDVVSGSYYEKAVAWAIENGITTGTGEGKFSPDTTCTRAQAVTFLARALNAKAEGKAEFPDVPTDSYFAEAVAWAASNGVTEGVGNGMFAPDNNCTRGQIVTFLWRAYNK